MVRVCVGKEAAMESWVCAPCINAAVQHQGEVVQAMCSLETCSNWLFPLIEICHYVCDRQGQCVAAAAS